ncbi:MAG: hypothetical protein IAE90_13455 [Ignavibacteria bacterium]|nr:hypothetical protein [Ignavibacteria bacterium]
MTLRYNSVNVQYAKAKYDGKKFEYDNIGIHVPCKTPLFEKNEYSLLDEDYQAHILSEHYLVLSIISSICQSLLEINEIRESELKLNKTLKLDMEYLLSIKLPSRYSFLESILKFAEKESVKTQITSNTLGKNRIYKKAVSFSSLVLPFIKNLKQIPLLKNAHFSLMMDDAHDLNKYQTRSLNSWISYRDHTDFSFKVAVSKVYRPERITSNGGTILEGHDFTSIEMEKHFYNKKSDYSKMAKRILKKRLEKVDINSSPEFFFPINPSFSKGLKESEKFIINEAKKKYKDKNQIYYYVYKYGRAEYFRRRDPKANLPPYSGLDIIIDISTGVVRNLLEPCFAMYDYELSNSTNNTINKIPHSTQTKIILSKSNDAWVRLQQVGLDKEIEGCSTKQAKQVFQLFDNLMILFRERLLHHKSLPRAIEFFISERDSKVMESIQPLLDISQKAQLLYTRLGSSKDQGRKEIFYIPNRILLPSRGLDPQGQHDRAAIKAKDIYNAAFSNKKFPAEKKDTIKLKKQGNLFYENQW